MKITKDNTKVLISKENLSMFLSYKNKLQTIIGLGILAALLSSLFSTAIIYLLLNIKSSLKSG